MARRWLSAVLLGHAAVGGACAQDSVRGAQLYLRLPADVPSCVTCHGPDPTQGRNNILRAADNPAALQKALNDVGAMGFLKPVLGSAEVVDLAAYLGRVTAMANPQGPVGVWPPTLEFGTLSTGGVSPAHVVMLENRGAAAWQMQMPDIAAGPFSLVHDCPASLPPGGRCAATVRAEPVSVGASTGVLRVTADATWSPLPIGLVVGTRAGGVPVVAAQSPDAQLQFPSVALGAGHTLSWTLVSNGTQAATLGTATVTGPQASEFSIGGDCASGRVLAPAATCTIQLTHRPVVALRSRATLQVRSNGTNPATLELVGDARAAADPTPPSADPVAPGGGGGGCAAGPGATPRFDPTLLVLLALAALRLRARRTVTVQSRVFHMG